MNLKSIGLFKACVLMTFSTNLVATEVDFSIAGGYPFFLVPEISLTNQDQSQRWHVNYKAGLDDGFSLGFEQTVGSRHALGVVIGAVGIENEENPCIEQQGFLACVVANVFDDETINGIGATYGFFMNGLNQSGWYGKFEVGYGEGSKSTTKHSTASLRIGYQF